MKRLLLALIVVSLGLFSSVAAPALSGATPRLGPDLRSAPQGVLEGLWSPWAALRPATGLEPLSPRQLAQIDRLAGTPVGIERASYPTSYDLRDTGRMTPPKNQLPHGTCWAFAAIGSLESCLRLSEPSITWDFSEDNLVHFSGYDPLTGDGSTLYTSGGNRVMATAYLARWSGPVLDSEDAYDDDVHPTGLSAQKHVQDVYVLPARSSSTDNDTLKSAVVTWGGVVTTMRAGGASDYLDTDDWNTQDWNNATYSFYYDGPAAASPYPDHAVVIAGWDDTYSKTNFATQPPGDGAFLIKNSYGTGFWNAPDDGYFWISYYDSWVGYDNVVYLSAEPTTNYTEQYGYDLLGNTRGLELGYSSETAWFASRFTATSDASIQAVGFYTSSVDATYEVYTGTGFSGSTLQGKSGVVAQGTLAIPGYHTVALDSSRAVTEGSDFVLAVKLTQPGNDYPIAVEQRYASTSTQSGSSQASANPGECYISAAGSSWTDLTSASAYPEASVCLKAYAGPPAADQPPALSLATTQLAATEGSQANRSGSVTDGDGDAVALSATVGAVVPAVTAGGGGSFVWSWTPVDGTGASSSVTIDADDGRGGSDSGSFNVVVANAAPQVNAGADAALGAGGQLDRQATFTDPGANDDPWSVTVAYGDGASDGPTDYGSAASIDLSHTYASPGSYTVTVTVTDKDGGAGSDTMVATFGGAAPTGPFTIASGAAYTSSATVTLDASGVSGAAEMQYRNSGGAWPGWEPFAATKTGWVLSAGDGTKTVEGQFRNASGTLGPISDTIVLDTTAPAGTFAINGGGATTGSTAVTLDSAVSDANPPLQMRFRDAGGSWTTWQAYAAARAWDLPAGDGAKTVEAEYRDPAGNVRALSDGITLEAGPPPAGSWTAQTSGETTWLESVDFADELRGWVAGDGGLMLHTTDGGATWSRQTMPTTETLFEVCFIDNTTGWATGRWAADKPATMMHTEDAGSTWSVQTTPEEWTLAGLDFVSGSVGCAVGNDTILWTTDGGESWSSQDAPVSAWYEGVDLMSSTVAWAVGDAGSVIKTSDAGATWVRQAGALTTADLYAVAALDESTAWAVGNGGTALRTTDGGQNWTLRSLGTSADLRSVRFISATTGWVVGSAGTILRTEDGGTTWTPEASGVVVTLCDVDVVSPTCGWAVGYAGKTLHYSPAPADTTPPTTTASGYDARWHKAPVTVTFSAVDPGGSGVAKTEYRLDAGAWTTGADATIAAPADHSKDGVHTVGYRSTDVAGNTETERSCEVRIDTRRPSTRAPYSAKGLRHRTVKLSYKVVDSGENAGTATVTIKIKTLGGTTVQTLRLGTRAVNKLLSKSFVCKLRKRTYRFWVYATDAAGNTQSSIGRNYLYVR